MSRTRRLSCALTLAAAVALSGCSDGSADPGEVTEEPGAPTTDPGPDEPTGGPGEGDDPTTEPPNGAAVELEIPDTLEGEVARTTYTIGPDGVPETTSVTVAEVDPELDYAVRVQCVATDPEATASVSVRDAVEDAEWFVTSTVQCDGTLRLDTVWVAGTRAEVVQVAFTEVDDEVTEGYALAVPVED